MADLSDKARRLLDWVNEYGTNRQIEDYIAALESVASAARSHRSVRCAINSRQLDEAIRHLDGAGEGDGNG